jgi:hypothetical protein
MNDSAAQYSMYVLVSRVRSVLRSAMASTKRKEKEAE